MTIHYRYWLLTLVLALIALATEKWSSSPSFTTYLSNAATLTSLLLGLVAIFYSFISNDSLSRGLGGIAAVSTEIANTKDKIASYLQKTDEINISVASSRELIQQARNSLVDDLDDLRSLLHEVKVESSELSGLVGSIPPRLEKVETGMVELITLVQVKQGENPERALEDSSSETFARMFLDRSSLDINLLIIAIVFSVSTEKSITCENLFGIIRGGKGSILGNILLLAELKLIAISSIGKSDEHWSKWPIEIAKVSQVFCDEAERLYLSRLSETGTEDQSTIDSYNTKLESVRQLFA